MALSARATAQEIVRRLTKWRPVLRRSEDPGLTGPGNAAHTVFS